MPPTRLEHIVGSTIAFLETAMTILFTRAYGLVPRGGAGLACDDGGVALGPLPLVEAVGDASGRRLYSMRPIEEIAQAAPDAIERYRRGLAQIVQLLRAGEDAQSAHPSGAVGCSRDRH